MAKRVSVKVDGRPKKCSNIPGSGACKKKQKTRPSYCANCSATGK